jgi:hypothetical protein
MILQCPLVIYCPYCGVELKFGHYDPESDEQDEEIVCTCGRLHFLSEFGIKKKDIVLAKATFQPLFSGN